MSKTVIEVLDLCTEFNKNVENSVQNNMEKQQKAQDVVAPHMDELEKLTQDLASIAMTSMMTGKSDDLENNEEFQNLNFKVFDILAIVYAEILDKNEVDAVIPAALKDESAVKILKERGAENLAKLIKR